MKSINRGSANGVSIAALVVAGAMIAMLAGCGGGGGGGGGGTNVANVALSGKVTNNGTPLAGLQVYVENSSPANTTTTDGNGNYTLTVPADKTITLAVEQEFQGCTPDQVTPTATEQVVVGGNATQTANIAVTSNPNSAPPAIPPCALNR